MIILRKNFEHNGIDVSSPHSVADDSVEEVCVDMTVGSRYLEAGSAEPLDFCSCYSLKAGSCIIIETAEKISLANNVFGLLCSRGSLAAKGILVPNTKIDPKFSGNLQIAVFNSGQRTVKIEKGQKFCSVIFQHLEGDVSDGPPRGSPKLSNSKTNPIGSFLRENWKFILSHIATIIISIGGAYYATQVGANKVDISREVSPQEIKEVDKR